MKKYLLSGFILLIGLIIQTDCIKNSLTKPEDETDTIKTIDIHADISNGYFKMSIGVNCGPLSVQKDYNYSSIYNELGITLIRTHDYYGPCDWYSIFPNWENDENNPESYNFLSSDQVVNTIISGGLKILFRLGPSWNDPVYVYNYDPPGTIRDNLGNITHYADHDDFLKFSIICRNIVRHYNDGWANGYNYNIKRWEIWNEPSLSDHFWSGTSEQFYDMFSTVLSTLKKQDSSLIIGGPGLAGHSTLAYESGFIEYCNTNNVPIDFFSWHNYGNDGGSSENAVQSPSIIESRANYIRNILDNNGFNLVKSICSEWNSDLGERNFSDSGKGAAFYASVLMFFEQNGITENYLYRGDDHPLGIFKNGYNLKIAAYTLKAWKLLSNNSIRIYTEDPDINDLAIISSLSVDKTSLVILISNYSSNNFDLRLNVHKLDTESRKIWQKTEWEISNNKSYEIISGPQNISKEDNIFKINVNIKSESVRTIRLTSDIKKSKR